MLELSLTVDRPIQHHGLTNTPCYTFSCSRYCVGQALCKDHGVVAGLTDIDYLYKGLTGHRAKSKCLYFIDWPIQVIHCFT